jgi:hypothetical protein
MRGWIKLHTKELHSLHSSPNNITMCLMMIRSMANEAQVGMINAFNIWIRKPERKS